MRSLLFFALVLVTGIGTAQDIQEALPGVNMAYDEKSPVISPDGKTLFFTISNHPQNVGGIRDPGDIWVSEFDGIQWSTPVHAGTLLNSRDFNGVAGFSLDGQQLYLLSHYDGTGNEAKTQGISVSYKTNSGWSKPENIFIPYFQNRSAFLTGSISSDGKIFVYSAETYGSRVEDIYVTIKGDDGHWSDPRSLGSKINTQFQELSPWLAPDGTTLYFSSNGRKGCRSFDVFVTKRLDDTWYNWSEPESLNPVVNSEGRELFFQEYPLMGFSMYTSTKNSDGYGDIKLYRPDAPYTQVAVTEPTVTPDSVVVQLVQSANPDEPYFTVKGKISNAKTSEIIPGEVLFESDTIYRATSAQKGYSLRLDQKKNYLIRVEAPGYVGKVERLEAESIAIKSLEMNFSLQPIEVGLTVTLNNVLFIQSQAELLPESYAELDEVVKFMQANPSVEIELSGHTDNRGTVRQLLNLSQARVDRVKRYLVSKGISGKRITGRGFGGTKPIASNDTEATRALNRRVEFTIKKL